MTGLPSQSVCDSLWYIALWAASAATEGADAVAKAPCFKCHASLTLPLMAASLWYQQHRGPGGTICSKMTKTALTS